MQKNTEAVIKSSQAPAIWLIILIAGLPQLSETIYSPSLPNIANSLSTSVRLAQYTLTVYLFGFAAGTLIWGKISDRLGRKPCVVAGLLIFILGCIGCYYATSIEWLMSSRFVQGIGGSIGSVLGQAICRDAFRGAALGKAYAIIGSAMSLSPAIGPLVGGFIADHYHWSDIFLFLTVFASMLVVLIVFRLPETHYVQNRSTNSLSHVALILIKSKKAVGYGLVVAGCHGITFSYFAEGPFFLITMLGLSPGQYGNSFVLLALSAMFGGIVSKLLYNSKTSLQIMRIGLTVMASSAFIFSCFILWHLYISPFHTTAVIIATVLMQMFMMFGNCIVTSSALAEALVDYQWCIGTASSLFGFFYYTCITLFTLLMGYLHNGTLLPMPLYFLSISLFMFSIYKYCLKRGSQ